MKIESKMYWVVMNLKTEEGFKVVPSVALTEGFSAEKARADVFVRGMSASHAECRAACQCIDFRCAIENFVAGVRAFLRRQERM